MSPGGRIEILLLIPLLSKHPSTVVQHLLQLQRWIWALVGPSQTPCGELAINVCTIHTLGAYISHATDFGARQPLTCPLEAE